MSARTKVSQSERADTCIFYATPGAWRRWAFFPVFSSAPTLAAGQLLEQRLASAVQAGLSEELGRSQRASWDRVAFDSPMQASASSWWALTAGCSAAALRILARLPETWPGGWLFWAPRRGRRRTRGPNIRAQRRTSTPLFMRTRSRVSRRCSPCLCGTRSLRAADSTRRERMGDTEWWTCEACGSNMLARRAICAFF